MDRLRMEAPAPGRQAGCVSRGAGQTYLECCNTEETVFGVNERMKLSELKIPGLGFGKDDLEKFLSGLNFPAEKQDLITTARDNGAPDSVIGALDRIPDRSYRSTDDVMKAFGSK